MNQARNHGGLDCVGREIRETVKLWDMLRVEQTGVLDIMDREYKGKKILTNIVIWFCLR